MNIFHELESNVRSYCRTFPEVFHRANGPFLYSESGQRFIDFFAGAGALNYGHNNDYIKHRMLRYLEEDNVLHALDMHTRAKRDFLHTFKSIILQPRQLPYKVQFCGPTGTDAVEAALKLARRAMRRTTVFAFTGAYHGMSLGALAATANKGSRAAAGVPLPNVTFVPYPGTLGTQLDSIKYIEYLLACDHSGTDKPAAILFETVQAEGGVNVAPIEWMRQVRDLCDRYGIVMICDDIQVGCFRTGPFFSFERAGIIPDMVLLSKSISGIGFPMSLVLMKPELDVWKPAEHTGTFRGNQIAFVAGAAALDYAIENQLESEVLRKEAFLRGFLTGEICPGNNGIAVRGLGMIWGIDLSRIGDVSLARKVSARCFELGLIIETAGPDDTVIKLMPPLTIGLDLLREGCDIVRRAIWEVLGTC
ncbi:MAG: diaminobutyrate--2-oxoglutarate transaminase [Verrucomicrobiales bacterium]|nr:diaminobutyrate--2-oxoglutarate transaminase [Verrucomicrobiales bacterium]